MTDDNQTSQKIRNYIINETPKTLDVYKTAVADGNDAVRNWARGRVDALGQILQLIDKEAHQEFRARWLETIQYPDHDDQ